MLRLKQIIRNKMVMLMISISLPILNNISKSRLIEVSDSVISFESFTGRITSIPYEFKEFLGFFNIHKIQNYGLLASYRPPYNKYGLKRNRRKLTIEPLHLPPEENRAFGNAGTDANLIAKSELRQSQLVMQYNQSSTNIISPMNNKIELKYEHEVVNSIVTTSIEKNEVEEKKKKVSDAFALARANRLKAKQKQSTNNLGSICGSNVNPQTKNDYDF